MTVIVKDLDMPKSCYDCPFNRSEYGAEYYEKAYCILTKDGMTKVCYKKRPRTCPLEEKPKVWMVITGMASDFEINAICDTLAKAEELAKTVEDAVIIERPMNIRIDFDTCGHL